MRETSSGSYCERGNDLVSFLYGEANESEAQNFKSHLEWCQDCQSEMAAFGEVRGSIGTWKDESLAGFVSAHAVAPMRSKSAMAALRQFFDLSPLWMKCAVGFAGISLCLLLGLALTRLGAEPPTVNTAGKTGQMYSQDRVNQLVEKARADEAAALVQTRKDEPQGSQTPKLRRHKPTVVVNSSMESAKGRRPLSKAEREQLAADLRLVVPNEESLNLLGDRINQ
jgi:hypothetical protein